MAGFLSGISRSLGQRAIVGVSIEGSDLRLISVRGKMIEHIISRALPPGLLASGSITDLSSLGSAIRTLLSDYAIPSWATIVAAYPDLDARSRILTLPRQAGVNVAEVVEREARRDPVMSDGSYRVYHQVVNEGDNQITVFVLAVRRHALSQYLSALRQAGITPKMVELRPLAMIRAVNQPHTLIANVEHLSMDVIVVSNNLPVIMRSVPLSGQDASLVDEVVSELERTIDSYNSDHPTPLSPRLPIVLAGEQSALPELRQAIEERLARPLAAPTCPFVAPTGFAAANYIVPIGLVLKAR